MTARSCGTLLGARAHNQGGCEWLETSTHRTPQLAATNARVRGVPHRKNVSHRTDGHATQSDKKSPIHLLLLHRSLIEVAATVVSTVGRESQVSPFCTHAFASMPASSTTAAAQGAPHDRLTPNTPPTLLLALRKNTPLMEHYNTKASTVWSVAALTNHVQRHLHTFYRAPRSPADDTTSAENTRLRTPALRRHLYVSIDTSACGSTCPSPVGFWLSRFSLFHQPQVLSLDVPPHTFAHRLYSDTDFAQLVRRPFISAFQGAEMIHQITVYSSTQ